MTLTADGETRTVMSYRDTVEKLLQDNGIILGPLDRYEGVSPTDPLVEEMEIRVVRVEEKFLTEEEQIPHHVLERPNNTMNEGESEIVVEEKTVSGKKDIRLPMKTETM